MMMIRLFLALSHLACFLRYVKKKPSDEEFKNAIKVLLTVYLEKKSLLKKPKTRREGYPHISTSSLFVFDSLSRRMQTFLNLLSLH